MLFKRSQSHSDALNFLEYDCKGNHVLIRLALNGAAE